MSGFEREGFLSRDPKPVWAPPPQADENGKERLAQKAVGLAGADFIARRILPLLDGSVSDWAAACQTTVLQNTGTGRLTLRYELGGATLLAKLYTDELGDRSYQVLRALWNGGFDSCSAYQVPQPLGFLPDHNLLIMRQVPGKPISTALEGDRSIDLVAGSRAAARWLATLHRSSLRMGRPEADWDSFKLFRMSSRLIKAAAAKPEHLDMARDLLDLVSERILKLPENRPLVQTHGRYHHDHIFVAPQAVAVIDLDRCCPSDPGKDVAEFLRVLRSTAFKRALDMAPVDEATSAFLQEYLAQVPEAAVSLGCYWSLFMFHSFLGTLKKHRDKEKRVWQELLDFDVREMKRALEIVA
jgi:hypothetical protein